MIKHRGFPGRLPGSDFQFTIRRAAKEPTPLKARERFKHRKGKDLEADRWFLASLIDMFGEEPFERGNLDAGRISWLLDREIVPADDPFDPADYEARLRVDMAVAQANFPELFQ